MTYDGNLDPCKHVSHFLQTMSLCSGNEAFVFKVFPSSLGEARLRWSNKARSISSWKQLSKAFLARFVTNRVPNKVDALLALKKGHQKSLRDYARRYWNTYNEIEGCNEELVVAY